MSSSLSSVSIGKLYSLNKVTNTITQLNITNVSTFDLASCTCKSVLASADYTVSYTRRDNGYYYIEKITADLTIYDSVTLDSAYCRASGASTKPAYIPQSFSVKYRSSLNGGSPAFYKSGNPGYIIGMPVLVSETDSGAIKRVNEYGFRFFAEDPSGQCFTKVTDVGTFAYDSTDFNFGSDAKMSCGIKLTADQLKNYCTTGTTD